ncbi:MAG: protein kinase [Planctomycetaceae bacterium]|nr:protein kinase [Planctomycetaceae bacterium]
MNDGQFLPPDEALPREDEISPYLEQLERLLESGESTDQLEEEIQQRFGQSGLRLADTLKWLLSARSELPKSGAFESIEAPTVRISDHQGICTFGRFRVIERIGAGGNGVVFRVFDPQLHREAALKVPRTDLVWQPEHERRFLHEARTAASLDHPQIVRIFEAGKVGTVNYILSAFCSGPNLASWMFEQRNQHHSVPPRLAAHWMTLISEGMSYAHQKGIVHRDLKPGNILLDPETSNGSSKSEFGPFSPRITDFGIAKFESGSRSMTLSGVILGTLPYMAPEQASAGDDNASPAVDIYSMGAILYELLGGRPPLTGDSDLEILRKIGADDPPLLRTLRTDIPSDLEAICMKALERNPRERYGSAEEFRQDLFRFLNGEEVLARPVSGIRRVVRSMFRKRISVRVAIIIGLILLITSAWLGINYYRTRNHRDLLQNQIDVTSRQASEHLAVREKLHEQVSDTYAADMHRIMKLWESSSTLLYEPTDASVEMKEVLKRYIPEPGVPDQRGFEWYLLSRLAEPDRFKRRLTKFRELPGHDQDVYFVKFTPDDLRLFTAGADRSVKLWDVQTGELLRQYLGHSDEVCSLDISDDGTLLATACQDHSIHIFDVDSARLRFHLTGHRDNVVSLCFDHSGKYLFSGDHVGSCRMWDVVNGTEVEQLTGHTSRVQSIHRIFSDGLPGGATRFISSAQDGLAHVWEPNGVDFPVLTPSKTMKLNGKWEIWTAADGRSSVLAGVGRKHDNLSSVLDFARLDSSHRFSVEMQDEPLTGVFTADMKRFVHAGRSVPFGVTDLGTRKSWGLPGTEEALQVWHMAASTNGCYLATADFGGKVSVWHADVAPDHLMFPGMPSSTNSLQWSPDGRRLVASRTLAASGRQNYQPSQFLIEIENPRTTTLNMSENPEIQVVVGKEGEPETARWLLNYPLFSEDNKRLFTLSRALGNGGWFIQTHDLEQNAMMRFAKLGDSFKPEHDAPVAFEVDESTDRFWIATPVGDFGKTRIDQFELMTGKHIDSTEIPGKSHLDPVATHQGRIALSQEHSLLIYNIRTGELVQEMPTDHVGNLTGTAFSHDGRRIATTSTSGGRVLVYDLLTSELIATLISKRGNSLEVLEFSPDGKRLVGGGPQMPVSCQVWTIPDSPITAPLDPILEMPLPATGLGLTALKFSPDGRFLAAGVKTSFMGESPLYRTPHSESAVTAWQFFQP